LRNFPRMVRYLMNPPILCSVCSVALMGIWELQSYCLVNWLSSKVICCFSTNSYFTDFRSTEAMIKHYQIKRNDSGQWYVAERHLFRSVPELIWYHQHNAAGKWGAGEGLESHALHRKCMLGVRYSVGRNLPVDLA
jgi:hypothetical protein